ncbi:MAG: hypothetical protein WC497_01380 [Patescibacteria group bacterium]
METPAEQKPVGSVEQPVKPIEKPAKKHHRLRTTLIVLAIIIVVLGVGVAATGLITIPGLSDILGTSKPKDLGVKASQEALTSLEKKMPVTIEGGASELCLACNQTYSGVVSVTANRTSEEMTSFLKLWPRQEDDILKNTQVKFIDGGLEISTKLHKYIQAPVYVKVLVERTSNKTVRLNITQGKIGIFSVPDKYLRQATDFFQDLVNNRLADVTGFSMDRLEYHDGYSTFSGTYPAVVKPASGKWTETF